MKIIALSIFVLAVFVENYIAEQQKVSVSVYYESLCPYARKFIVNQLYPTLDGDLSKYIDLELVPYGKAETTTADNNVTFLCQHGPKECYGNLIAGCSQILIDSGANSPNLSFNIKHLKFLHCFLANISSTSEQIFIDNEIDRCTTSQQIGVTSDELKHCAATTTGITNLVKNGKLTDAFQNPLKHMPTIVFNGVFSEEDNEGSKKDFQKVLCSKITWERPLQCTN